MREFDQQLHGYRQGHQLLSSTIRLSKADQDLIDRLSDVAGPLSPGERFSPYLTLYPLPGATHYVIARTWQDFEAPRAGCVRTRSVLVPIADWESAEDVLGIVQIATDGGTDRPAERRPLVHSGELLPLVDPLQGTELIEAVFLEERAPIVVFDAEQPEVLALRLTTALWPSFRRGFSISTFARSPRTIGRRSFDVVFASKDSRPRFSDWEGRRIDGRKRVSARHPWSEPIVNQVLRSPHPSLQGLDSLGEMSSDGVGSESALRVSLLWDDLRRKLPTSPNAALGMLDIANTRKVRKVEIIRELEPALAKSAELATKSMEAVDAWRYLGALIQKLDGLRPSMSLAKAIRAAAIDLSARHPLETIDVLSSLNVEPQRELLVSAAADGISRSLGHEVADGLTRLDGSDLLDLLFASAPLAAEIVGRFPAFSVALAEALRGADDRVRHEARRRLLGLFVDDRHVEPARILIDDLDLDGLLKEAAHVGSVNQFESAGIRTLIVDRARALQSEAALRDAVIAMDGGAGGSALVQSTLHPTATDFGWVFDSRALDQRRRSELMRWLLKAANQSQLRSMLSDPAVIAKTVESLNVADATDAEILVRIAHNASMPSRDFVLLVVALLPRLRDGQGVELIARALDLSLPMDTKEISIQTVEKLLSAAGERINGAKIFRQGLQRGVSPNAASRNLEAFGRAQAAIRRALLSGVEAMASAIVSRNRIDLSVRATEMAAALLWESKSITSEGFVRAATKLLPFALNQRHVASSPLIAAAFPPVYRELARDNTFDPLSYIFVFLDWDKCKSARRRLVDAFVGSEWRVTDIATAAVRAGDPVRILGRLAKEREGEKALKALIAEISQVPDEIGKPLRAALKELGFMR